MDNLVRVRQASLRVAKVQRRIWLLQTLFLPVAVICCAALATAVAVRAWRRHAVVGEPSGAVGHFPQTQSD
jgi:hypothetical protein